MTITKPAGRSLTVGELCSAFADAAPSMSVNVTAGIAGELIPLLCVERTGQCVEIAIDAIDHAPLIDFIGDIIAGEYTLKQAKEQARLVLADAGFEVEA